MKKFLFLIALIVLSTTLFAQVSVTIDNVEHVTNGKIKGDLITYTVTAPSASVWGVGFSVVFNGVEQNGAGGVYNPQIFSNTTTTTTKFVGLNPNYLSKERSYTVTVVYDKGFYDPTDPGFVTSEPYTVPGK